jgi:CheY-like chemotaxis protein
MREKGGILEVSLAMEDIDQDAAVQYSDLNPGSYLKLTVSDTGSGMDSETMRNIFEPYFTTKMPGEGTGMGLALVHGIVKSYGGDITVESDPGKGTTFNVYIPKVEVTVSSFEEAFSSGLSKGSERVLFVDDEKGIVDAMRLALESLGYRVTAMRDSVEALEAFRHNPEGFDIIITDMTMPNMTGKELAEEIISIRHDMPVILCTGFSEQISKTAAEGMGISAFLMKPVGINDMANTIREVLDKISTASQKDILSML